MTKFCENCGSILDEKTGRCSYCDSIKKRSKKKAKKKVMPIFISTLSVVLVISVCLGGYWHFFRQKKILPVDNQTSDIIQLGNDKVYHPGVESIEFDSESNVAYFNDTIVVYLLNKPTIEEKEELCSAVDGEVVGELNGSVNYLQIKIKSKSLSEINELSDSLMKYDNVLFAGYDYPIQICENEDTNPWSDKDSEQSADIGNEENPSGNDWWAEAIGAYTAWDNIESSSKIKVGIIDSGFETNHSDLSGKIKYLDNYKANSPDEHGTHVAGVISANNNSIGIRGVCDSAELICVDWSPKTNDSDSGDYINYLSTGEYISITKQLIDSGVKVINNSWGTHVLSQEGYTEALYGESNDLMFLLEYFAVDSVGAYDSYLEYIEARSQRTGIESMMLLIELMINDKDDFFIVQSAGNGYDNGGKGFDADMNGFYCSIDESLYNRLSQNTRQLLANKNITYSTIDERIVIVGAVKNQRDSYGNYVMTGFSNYGNSVDICAPGEEIYSTYTNNTYAMSSGTSMAGPIVAGSLAAIWSEDEQMTVKDVRKKLFDSSEVSASGVGNGKSFKYPMLNIGNAIKNGKTITAQEAVDIYLSNSNIWMENPEYDPMNGYHYGFLDLDFDGVLELILNLNDGSGRYSYNSYYRINQDTKTVEKIKLSSEENSEGGYDYVYSSDPLLLKDKKTGKLYYYCTDFLRIMTGDYAQYHGSLYMNNGVLESELLYSEHTCEAGLYDGNSALEEFAYYEDGKKIDISKEKYVEYQNAFLSKHNDLKMSWGYIEGNKLESADKTTQRNLLLEAYTKFSYDGFRIKE